jgi:hypothetical protein
MLYTMSPEYAVELATSNIRFGAGVTRELGMDLADMGLHWMACTARPTFAGAWGEQMSERCSAER